MIKIVLLQTGKTNERYLSEGIERYSCRIRKYCDFEIVTLPELKNTRNMPFTTQKEQEGKKILQFCTKDDLVIALDEKGKEFTTSQFAGELEKMFRFSKKRIVFVIGGPWGLSDEFLESADNRISLSRLTFSHQLVRLLFAEQLYRMLTVIKGDPYHHE